MKGKWKMREILDKERDSFFIAVSLKSELSHVLWMQTPPMPRMKTALRSFLSYYSGVCVTRHDFLLRNSLREFSCSSELIFLIRRSLTLTIVIFILWLVHQMIINIYHPLISTLTLSQRDIPAFAWQSVTSGGCIPDPVLKFFCSS